MIDNISIIKEFKNEIEDSFKNITMIIYGSTVFGVQTSDLDVCFIREHDLSEEGYEILINKIKQFHHKNNLRIDEEIPYKNKLVYTNDFIEKTFEELPFPYIDGKYIIPKIKKNKEFLSSIEMRKRLLLNVLTVKHLIINGNDEELRKYEVKAWEKILKVVISYCDKKEFSRQELLECLYVDPYTKESGEMYLGYKNNLDQKTKYLDNVVGEQIINLKDNKKLVKSLGNKYIPKESWLKP